MGNEISRVEIPEWVHSNKYLLDLTHSAIVNQCEKGRGYPVALMEAHEQAVVTNHDREEFRKIVEDALMRKIKSSIDPENIINPNNLGM